MEASKEIKDVEMEVVKSPEEEQKELLNLLLADIKQNVINLEKAVNTIENRFITRVLRTFPSIRRRLTDVALAKIINIHESESMELDQELNDKNKTKAYLPEVETYLLLLVLIYLHDKKEYEKGAELSSNYIDRVISFNRRTMDMLAAKFYFYYSRFFELTNRLSSIRTKLLAAQRTTALRHDSESQATILNLLLRNYLHYNLVEQADKLVLKTTFPEEASNNQFARYMLYLGRIKAIQLDYTSANRYLLQAIRKAPQTSKTVGFLQAANKLSIIVQILMGEIPAKSLFKQPELKKSLEPYFHITQAVRVGDLTKFKETLNKYTPVFRADNTYTLILRLRHNVIKTGIRMISLSYSRISLRDICHKLQLDSEEDAEYIIAKAIRDGVIDATINHEEGYMKSKEIVDIYSTNEPQEAFNECITFCLNLRNESVKAMRFPSNAYRKELASAKEIDDEERKLAKEIEDGELDDDSMDDDY
ncbi:PCI domain-containing protein [Neocallimastix lanati (nom. inval.)]|nr:PCI domain-containing protein [Neocallimastix sp. JGI-2020a]